MKRTKVKQVMADLALSQVANKSVEYLTQSEYRRLMIGIQLIRDPGNFHIFTEKIDKVIIRFCISIFPYQSHIHDLDFLLNDLLPLYLVK